MTESGYGAHELIVRQFESEGIEVVVVNDQDVFAQIASLRRQQRCWIIAPYLTLLLLENNPI